MASYWDTRNTPYFENEYLRAVVGERVYEEDVRIYWVLEGRGTNDVLGGTVWRSNDAADAFMNALRSWTRVMNLDIRPYPFNWTQGDSHDGLVTWVERMDWLGADNNELGHHDGPEVAYQYGGYNNQHPLFTSANNAIGGISFVTFIHEIGHALGLRHPHDGNLFPGVDSPYDAGDFGLNQSIFTIMSYRDGADEKGPSPSYAYGYQATPGAFDIAAVQALYGAKMTTATGDDVYLIPGVNQPGTYYSTIWDAAGIDTISAEGLDIDVYLDLRAATLLPEVGGGGFLSSADGIYGGFTIANGVVIENAIGGNGNDTIVGNAADNVLEGGFGDDLIDGGDGIDTATFSGNFADYTIETVDDTTVQISGADGTDILSNMEYASFADTTVYIGQIILPDPTEGDDLFELTSISIGSEITSIDALGGIDTLDASAVFAGTYAMEFRTYSDDAGYAGPDVIQLADYELVNFEILYGSDIGRNRFFVPDYTAPLTLYGGQYADKFFGSWDNPDVFYGGGSDDEFLIAEGDAAYGEEGNDTFELTLLTSDKAPGSIDGGTGIDTLEASFGALVDLAANTATRVNGAVSTLLNVENVEVHASYGYSTSVSGSSADNHFYVDPLFDDGSAGVMFAGRRGNDLLDGSAASDELYGDLGDDVLAGNASNDLLFGGSGADVLDGGAGDDLLDGGDDIDTASFASASAGVVVTLRTQGVAQNTRGGGHDTLVSIENLAGSNYADRLVGTDGNNTIDGLDGQDKLYGFGGRDILSGGMGGDRISGGEGNDRINGNDGDDRLDGDEGDDLLVGHEGNDRINGGLGADEMAGGSGDDIYFVDNVGDVIIEASGRGTDRVVAGIDYTLGNNLEVLRLRTGDLDGTGNGLDNLIRGLGGSNVLSGEAGDDDIYGGTGNDTLIGGDGIDRLYGEVGSDILTGGADKDFFIFNAADELGDRVNISDIITDFSQSDNDLINVRGIDADTTTEGDQNFVFIGDTAFSGTAGELRYYQSASRTFIEMDIDGDGVGDLFIRLDGVIDLTAGDFVL